MEEIRTFLMLSFPCNLAELCIELHRTSNFLSSMLLFRFDHFLTRKYGRFTKSFSFTCKISRWKRWQERVNENCHPPSSDKSSSSPIFQKNFNIHNFVTLLCSVNKAAAKMSLATVTSRISTMLEPMTRASFQSSLLLSMDKTGIGFWPIRARAGSYLYYNYIYIRHIMINCQTFQVIKYYKEEVLSLFISGKRLLDCSVLQFLLNDTVNTVTYKLQSFNSHRFKNKGHVSIIPDTDNWQLTMIKI